MLENEVPYKLQNPATSVQLKECFATERKAQPGKHYHGDADHVRDLAAPAAMLGLVVTQMLHEVVSSGYLRFF